MPRDLTPVRNHYEEVAVLLRERRAALNGHYNPERVRARVDAATCDEVAIWDREEHVDAITETVLRKVTCL